MLLRVLYQYHIRCSSPSQCDHVKCILWCSIFSDPIVLLWYHQSRQQRAGYQEIYKSRKKKLVHLISTERKYDFRTISILLSGNKTLQPPGRTPAILTQQSAPLVNAAILPAADDNSERYCNWPMSLLILLETRNCEQLFRAQLIERKELQNLPWE